MQNTYVQFDLETGIYIGSMTCSPAMAVEQFKTGLIGMLKVEANPLETGFVDGVPYMNFNWEIIRKAIAEDIDAKAEAVCRSFVTPGETQIARYLRKEAEARAWLLDDQAPIPMVQAEAVALGKEIADLVNEIIAQADLWTAIMATVEAKRLSAKQSLETMTNIKEMVDASNIDWAS